MPQYYPALNKLIQVDKIPDPLKTAISESMDRLFYKGYYAECSVLGDVAYYNLTIVINSKIGLNVFGGDDNFQLLFNPGEALGTTEIPLALYYNLPILKYIRTISTSQLSTPKDYFDVIVKLLEISPSRVLFESIYQFFDGSIEGFVGHFNANPDYSSYPPLNVNDYGGNDDEIIFEIASELEAYGINVYTYVAEELIAVENDIPASFENLYTLFRGILGDFNSQKILGLFIPKFSVSIQTLELALAFPRTWLKPVDANGEVIDDDSKSLLTYNVGSLSYHSEKGFEFINPDSFDLTPSQIGNTGLLVEIQNLKFDFRNDKNIPEADADGRGLDFKGVYTQYAAVTLPKKWFNSEESNVQTTARIAGYDLLVGTGGISGTIALETVEYINPDGQITDYFSSCFDFQYPITLKVGDSETDIADYTTLLQYMNNSANAGWQFVFPLSITKADTTTETFENVRDYHLYLNTCDGNLPKLVKTIGSNGFEVSFSSFDLTFKQNKIVESNIVGGLKIPKLKDAQGNDAYVEVTGHLDSDGDFVITGSEQDGFAPIEIPNVLKIYVQGVSLGSEDGNFFIGTQAEIEFTNPIMSKLLCSDEGTPTRIALPAVRIYSNGNFEIVGGAIPIPTNFGLCLGPVNISITNLNFTSTQREFNGVMREYKCWGFDGALNVDPLGVDVRGNGVKYCYTVDDDPANGKPRDTYIHISTIEVDLIIPGDASPASAAAIINGYVSIPEPGVSTEYAGGVSLKLPKAGISGSVETKVDPKYPAFILDAEIEIPVPIPLAATGLGVFGFRGLLGFRYVAEKEAVGLTSGEDTWYDYFLYPKRGINVQKFRTPGETSDYKNPFSFGAGAAFATYGNDTIINFRVFLLLSIPSLFFIEGKASILSENLGLDGTGEPPFYAFLAIGDNSIEAGLGADFRIPQDTGDLLDLQAKIEAGFFFKNPSAFYINIGTKQDPITARIVSLITAQLFLQIAAKGIEAGARAEFEFDKSFGPARVRAYAYIEMGGKISFERPQLSAYLGMGGEALVDIKIISVYVGLDMLMAGEAPKPFLLYGLLSVRVNIKIIFVRIKFTVVLEIKWEKSREVDSSPIPPLPSAGQYMPSDLVKGMHMLTGDVFDIKQLKGDITSANWEPSANNPVYSGTVIPLDTYIDFKFGKAVDPTLVEAKTGGVNNPPTNYTELIPPQSSVRGQVIRQVKHEYSLQDIKINAWNGSEWINYNPYEALEPGAVESGVVPSALKIGHWQKPGKEYNALRLLGDSPFSFTQLGEPGWYLPEQLGITEASLFCQGSELEPECANWLKKQLGVTYLADTDEDGVTSVENFFTTGRMGFWVKGPIWVDNLVDVYNASVVDKANSYGFAKSLELFNFMSVELRVPNPSKIIKLKLSTAAEGVTLGFYKTAINDGARRIQFELVDEIYKTRAELEQEVIYTNTDQGIIMILVQPDFLNIERINALHSRLEELKDGAYETYADGGGETEKIGSSDAGESSAIQREIVDLIQGGCAANVISGDLVGGIGQMQTEATFRVGIHDLIIENLQEYVSCTTLIHEVCWLTAVDYDYNEKIPKKLAIETDFALTQDSVAKVIAPIWRPETKYYLHLTLRDTVDNPSASTIQDYHYYYGFRTAGPVGHFHNANGVTYGLNAGTGETNRDSNGKLIAPDRFPLTNLSRYIDYQRSYPNANGNLLASKPLYYGNEQAKLLLFFVKPQIYHMFNTWPAYGGGFTEIESEMKIIIKDPVNDTLIPYPLPEGFDNTIIPGGVEAWEDDEPFTIQENPLIQVGGPLEPHYVKLWNNLVAAHHDAQTIDEDDKCIATGGQPVRPKSKKRTVTLTNLKPQKLYTALVNNVYQPIPTEPPIVTEVHNYVFKTSRYANFSEQVNSYQLDDGDGNTKEAIFQVPLSLSTAEIDTSLNIIDSAATPDTTNESLSERFADRFDRVVEGIWGQPPLPVAETMEFNAVIDQNTGDTVALWVRNPEPFNDPKMPEDTISESIQVLNNANDDADSNYKSLFSKDYTQVLIMRNNKRITNNALRIRFQYLLWDGNIYAVEDTVLVENLNIL